MAETYDTLYRRLFFGHAQMARDLLAGFVLQPDRYRIEMLETVPEARVSDRGKKRQSDRIWKIRAHPVGEREAAPTDQGALLYVLLEFQSDLDEGMALRTLVYAGLLLQELHDRAELRETGLPDTLSVVPYSGKERWRAPTHVSGLLKRALPDLGADQPAHQYRLIDEAVEVSDGFDAHDNFAAALFVLEHPRNHQELVRVLRLLVDRLSGRESRGLRCDLT